MICFILLKHLIPLAFSLALERAGRSIDARTAMIEITTSNSMRVKPSGRSASGSAVAFFMIAPQVSSRLRSSYWTVQPFAQASAPRCWYQRLLNWYIIPRTLTSLQAGFVPEWRGGSYCEDGPLQGVSSLPRRRERRKKRVAKSFRDKNKTVMEGSPAHRRG